jgi:hypothetical protein
MSKLYQLNMMRGSPAAGSILTLLKGAGKLIGGLFKSKAGKAVATAAKTAIKNPVVQGAAGAAGWLGAESLLEGGGKKAAGASGYYGARRHRGITYTELKGFRKVARLLHKEGMVSKKARRG